MCVTIVINRVGEAYRKSRAMKVKGGQGILDAAVSAWDMSFSVGKTSKMAPCN